MKPLFGGFLRCTARWQIPKDGGFINGDGNPQMEATAEGRLYNHSPRLACLPGVRARKKNLPPKSGCINQGKYLSKLSQRPAIGSGVPPAREMGRMRSAYRVTEKCRRSATMYVAMVFLQPLFGGSCVRRRCHGGRRANPVLTY